MILTHKVKAGAIALLEGARRLLNVSPDALYLVLGRRADLDAFGAGRWPGVEWHKDIDTVRVVVGRIAPLHARASTGPLDMRRIADAIAPQEGTVPVIQLDAAGWSVRRVQVSQVAWVEGGAS